MVKLTNPLAYNGRIYPIDTEIALPEDFEDAILRAGNAVRVVRDEPAVNPEGKDPLKNKDQREDENQPENPEGQQDFELMLGR